MVCFLVLKMDQTQKLSSITVVFAAIFDNKNIWLILQSYKFLRAPLCVIGVYRRFLYTVDFLNVFMDPQKKIMREVNMDHLFSPFHHHCHILKCSAQL